MLWRSAVAFLPEMVFVYNSWQQQWQRHRQELNFIQASRNNHHHLDQFIMELDVPTMGCVACINAIDSKLRKVPGVLGVTSQLKPLGTKGGSATVLVATNEDATTTSNRIIEAFGDIGFDGAVLTSIRPKTVSSTL